MAFVNGKVKRKDKKILDFGGERKWGRRKHESVLLMFMTKWGDMNWKEWKRIRWTAKKVPQKKPRKKSKTKREGWGTVRETEWGRNKNY